MVRVSGAWRLVRARSRRRARSWTRAWRSSLQIRVITSTLAIGLVALTLVGAYVSGRMADGLFNARLEQVLQESARSTLQAQTTFDSSTATTGTDVQRLKGDVAEAQRTGGSDRREVFLLRAPGQQGGDMFIPGAASDQALVPLVSRELRLATAGGGQHWQSVAIPRETGGVSPGVMVGQDVTVPVDGTYQLFFLYSLQSEQDRLDFLQRTLGLAAVALVVLLGSMTWLVTRQTVRPVRRAAEVAERLADGHLSERMPEKGEDEMATLARSFNEMADSLQDQIHRMEELSTLQRRFVSDVSHELRTPLTTIRMAGEVIHASREDFDPAAKRSAELLQTQLDRFEDLLADLLEISRFDAGAAVLDAEGRDVRDVVIQAVDHAAPLAERRGAWLHVVVPEERCVADIDPRRVERILRNLLVNAVEHAEGSTVEVTVGADAHAVAVTVRDRGVGMTPGRGRARVRPVLARRPRACPHDGRHRPRAGDLAGGRPPARRLARGVGPARPRRELPAHAPAPRGDPADRVTPAAAAGRVADHRCAADRRAPAQRPGRPARHGVRRPRRTRCPTTSGRRSDDRAPAPPHRRRPRHGRRPRGLHRHPDVRTGPGGRRRGHRAVGDRRARRGAAAGGHARPRSSTASSPRAPRASPTTSRPPGSTSRARPRRPGTRLPASLVSGPVEPAPTHDRDRGHDRRPRRGPRGRGAGCTPRRRRTGASPSRSGWSATTPTSGGSPRRRPA